MLNDVSQEEWAEFEYDLLPFPICLRIWKKNYPIWIVGGEKIYPFDYLIFICFNADEVYQQLRLL